MTLRVNHCRSAVSLTPSSVTALPETSISVPFRYSDSLSLMVASWIWA